MVTPFILDRETCGGEGQEETFFLLVLVWAILTGLNPLGLSSSRLDDRGSNKKEWRCGCVKICFQAAGRTPHCTNVNALPAQGAAVYFVLVLTMY